jgi:thiol-disulfide isomerase/thioredoxin
MKKLLLLCSLLASFNCLAKPDNGITFSTGQKWSDLLARAKAENKLIFVDMYTVWCGPCKTMDNDVFPLPAVGTFFNQSFINTKIDAEKGEGLTLQKKYSVASYPNYLFINGDGVPIYRTGGSMTAAEFIRHGKNALTESQQKETIVQLEAAYPGHKSDKTFMYQYLSRLTALRLPTTELLDEYIRMLSAEEQAQPQTIQLIVNNGTFVNRHLQLGISLDVLRQNLNVFQDLTAKGLVGKIPFGSIEDNARQVSLHKAILNKDEQLLHKVQATEKEADLSPYRNKLTTALDYYLQTKNYSKYKAIAKDYINNTLLRVPMDSLLQKDLATYTAIKADIEKANNPAVNTPENINTYKHTQSINMSNQLSAISEQMLQLNLTAQEVSQVSQWALKAVKISNIDPDYFKNAAPHYRRTYAMALYRANQQQPAMKLLQNIIQDLPDTPSVRERYGELLAKMKAHKKWWLNPN